MSDADLETYDKIAGVIASAVMRRFDALMGPAPDPAVRCALCCIAFVAASEVLRIVFTADEPFRALDEFEALEASLRSHT